MSKAPSESGTFQQERYANFGKGTALNMRVCVETLVEQIYGVAAIIMYLAGELWLFGENIFGEELIF